MQSVVLIDERVYMIGGAIPNSEAALVYVQQSGGCTGEFCVNPSGREI